MAVLTADQPSRTLSPLEDAALAIETRRGRQKRTKHQGFKGPSFQWNSKAGGTIPTRTEL